MARGEPPRAGRGPLREPLELRRRRAAGAGAGSRRRRRLDSSPILRSAEECLDVVRRAPRVDLAFADVSGGHADHPHRGATRNDGATFGYVPDDKFLRRGVPPPFRLAHDEAGLRRACSERDDESEMLSAVVVGAGAAAAQAYEPARPRVRLLCALYTVDSRHGRIPAILGTWGQRCDGFFAASNRTDPSLGTVNIPHDGPESLDNMWHKVRSIWSFVYDTYCDQYDWFHIGGDGMYVIVDNLRPYLESDEIRAAASGGLSLPVGNETEQVPLYLGRPFANSGDRNDTYNTGGPGYTLNRAALKALVVRGLPRYETGTAWSAEDILVARALREFGIFPYDTRDEDGGERYMHFSPGQHHWMQGDERLNRTSAFTEWYWNVSARGVPDRTSARSVAFHYLDSDRIERIHALLYGYCGSAQG